MLLVLVGITSVVAEEPPSIESAFSSITAQITTTSDATNVPVEWKYTNHTDLPLFVEKLDISCGCLSPQAQNEISVPVEPGKTGVIRANFTPGGHRGLVRKSLHVRFVGYEKPVELIAEANIPKTVELSATDLVWDAASKVTKDLEVTSGTGDDFHITSLDGISENQFQISQETITPGRCYRIHITPKEGVNNGIQNLILKTDSRDPRDQALAVFLQISSPKPASQTVATP